MTKIINNITKSFLLLLALAGIAFTSCTREFLPVDVYEGDGRTVTVNIPVVFSDYDLQTRALTDNESRKIDDIAVFIFQSSTGQLQFSKFFNADQVAALADVQSQTNHSNAKAIPVSLPTGTYKIAAVANYNAPHLDSETYDKLRQVSTWSEFCDLDVRLNENYPMTRSRLPMCGYYQSGSVDCTSYQTCPDVAINGMGDLEGYIHLRRLDAEIKFNIYNDIDGRPAGLDGMAGDYTQTCTRFEIQGWQVVNLPKSSFINDNVSDIPAPGYSTSSIQGISKPDPNVGDGSWSFDFYMMENRKAAAGLTKYEERELNHKNEGRADNQDPDFVNAPGNSTYVKFTANIEILLAKGPESIKRIATATYYVHLGATRPVGSTDAVDYNDFRTNRNTKYTYNVKVQGVDKIVVEAISDADPNPGFQNGQEGLVVDLAGGRTIDLDAHYAVFNIDLTRREISKMGLIITSAAHPSGVNYIPGAGPGGSDINGLNVTCDDYQHIRFAPLSAQQARVSGAELVVYSNTYDVKALSDHPTEAQSKEGGILPLEDEPTQAMDANHYVPLYDFITLKKSFPLNGDASDDQPMTFSVFVSEYYYYNDFNLHHDTDLGEENWQKFTNTINRQYVLLSDVNTSADDHSTHVAGKYVINQRSIQTYYGMDSEEGLGIEHVNEHHHKNMTGSRPSTSRQNNGWFNSAFYMGLMNNSGTPTNTATWAAWSSQEKAIGHEANNDFYPTFKTKYSDGLVGDGNYKGGKYGISSDDRNVNYYAIPACLARNRDLNRDGIIQTDELRWFLPGIQQYVQFAIGLAALETPLFAPGDYDNSHFADTKGGNTNNIYSNYRFHFLSSDHYKIWTEEGTSLNSLNNNVVQNAWEIRCCRYLKANGQYTANDNQLIVAHPYNHNSSTRVMNVRGYDEKCLRENTPVLPVRDNFDTKWNSIPRNFQYASTTITRPNAPNVASLSRDVDENVYCSTYHDPAFGDDMSDVGSWRIPNQRELALLYYENLAGNGYFAGTFWYYGNYTNSIVFGYDAASAEAGSKYYGNFGIRSGNLCLNHSNNLNTCKTIRCVRDTDSAGNYYGKPEYGNPVNFEAGNLTTDYVGDNANYSVNATMDAASVASVSVKIDGITAASTGSGTVTSTVSGAPVNKSTVFATWTIVTTSGKTLTYRKSYDLPARYWLISNYNYQNRYAYVNTETNRTSVGAADSRSADDIEAVYKWVFTTTPGGSPVNVSDLQPETTYYMYNAGSQSYISGPASGSSSFMTVGGSAIPVKLQLRSGYNGFYVIRVNNSTSINRNGGAGNFGTWNGADDGCTYKLTPAVLKGEMPMHFSFASDVAVDGGKVKISATTEATATVTAVKIAGVNATVTGSGTSYTAAVDLAHVTGSTVTTEWSLTFNGQNYTRTKTYTMPDRYNATRLTFAEINAMAEGETKTVIWGNPSSTKPIFVSHNGTSPSYTSLGFNNAATLATAAQNCADNDNYHFVLTKVSGGYTLKSVHGGFSPNRNGGSVQWSATADVLTLTNYTGGSTSAIVEWVPGCSVRIEKSGAWININGPVYNTGAGDWVKFYFYEVETLY
ncbi:MAG: hypothetical protein MJY72_06690 [Bacteroidales bacterium]|nr:hypothetical protein [Bacteroidales bacterium]